jgi:hypothetical protein
MMIFAQLDASLKLAPSYLTSFFALFTTKNTQNTEGPLLQIPTSKHAFPY